MKTKATKKHLNEYVILALSGALIGLICFISVYGFRILNPLYDNWIFNTDIDLSQHYNGFCHFRNSAWQFPIGLVETLSVPYKMSIVYTDSIPLFAIVAKIFSPLLPAHFQYFGIYGLLSFMLQGALSSILLRRFIKEIHICLIGAVFFIMSFQVVQRLFYHTALASHWIIVLALVVLVYVHISDNFKKSALIWGLIGIICVFIHSYFVPMCGMILLAQVFCTFVKDRKAGRIKRYDFSLLTVTAYCSSIISFCLTAFISLFILGGFYGAGSISGEGIGAFTANLNTYINCLNYGTIFRPLPLERPFQYEGFGYLGGGIIVLFVAISVFIIVSKFDKYKNRKLKIKVTVRRVKNYIKRFPLKSVFLMLIFLSLFCAVFPTFSFNNIKLVGVPLPGFLKSILNIFRSNGRFIWVSVYIIIMCIIVLLRKYVTVPFSTVILIAALIVQLCDLSGALKEKSDYFKVYQPDHNMWKEIDKLNICDGKDKFIFMYESTDAMMQTAFYGYLKGMTLNNFYYARPINDLTKINIDEEINKFSNGIIDEKAVYIFKSEDLTDELLNVCDEKKLMSVYYGSYVILTELQGN